MLGLVSLTDAIMDMTFKDIAQLTQISDELVSAIVDGEGKFGELLGIAIHYERSEWDKAFELGSKHGIGEDSFVEKYLEAVNWTNMLA